MDCPKRGCAVAGLPDDPLVEILSRVPVKSLRRSKCVSKAWRDLIADPLHRRKLPQTLEGFFCGDDFGAVRVHGYGDGGDGCCCGCSNCRDHVFIDLMERSAPLVNPSFSFLTEELPDMEHFKIVHSCNGLLLLRHGKSEYTDRPGYVVCNPATEEWVAVPSSGWFNPDPPEAEDDEGNDSDRYADEGTFLIFDPAVSSHFTLLQFLIDRIPHEEVGLRTYSSETELWTDRSGEQRRLEEGGESLQLGTFWSISFSWGSAFVNGMLHFIADHIQKAQELIVAVDWEGKTRRVISLPRNHGCNWSDPAFVGQSQGSLYCISEDIEVTSSQITVWVLEDYDKEEWVFKHRVSPFQLFGDVELFAHFHYRLVAIHPDRNLIFISYRDKKLISYNMDSKEVHALGTFIERCEWVPHVPYYSESSVLSKKH